MPSFSAEDASITLFFQYYAVSYIGYLLEEACYRKFDCLLVAFAFKLHVQNSRLNPQPRVRAHLGLSPSYSHGIVYNMAKETQPYFLL